MSRIALAAAAALFVCGSAANALTYNVNRVIGAGTVTGFIETNGVIGNVAVTDVVDWGLTITAPNISSPNPTVLTRGVDRFDSAGAAFIATSTELFFDFTISGQTGSWTIFQDISGGSNYWCLDAGFCSSPTSTAPSEDIGFRTTGGDAQSVSRSGLVAIASTAAAPVPLPAALPLLVIGLGGLGILGRRRSRSIG